MALFISEDAGSVAHAVAACLGMHPCLSVWGGGVSGSHLTLITNIVIGFWLKDADGVLDIMPLRRSWKYSSPSLNLS